MNYFIQIVLNIYVVFSHLFYIPTIIACLWWKKKGLIVALFLAVSLVLFPFLFGTEITSLENVENLLQALIFIIIGVIVSIFCDQISKIRELTKAYEDVKFYRDLFTHDINNTLQNILSSTETYSIYPKKELDVEEIENLMNIVRDQSYRAIKIISNVEILAKLEESETYLQKVNIMELIEDAIKSVKNGFQLTEINVFIEPPVKLIWAKANELLLDVFENILRNAITYNRNSIVEINIKISNELYRDINYLKIEIQDNGIGISDDRKQIIFERQYNKDKYSKGMGFGLSVVKKVLDKYKGKIWVEVKISGDYSKGSNFIILIPEAF